MKGNLFISLLFSLVASCISKEESEVAIHTVLDSLIQADRRADLEAVIGFYSEDAILMAPDGLSIIGKKRIREHYSALFKQLNFKNLKASADEILVDGNFGVIAGKTEGTVITKDTQTAQVVAGKYIMIFKRIDVDHDWKISRLIWNDTPINMK